MPVNKLENSLRDVMILLIYYPMHSFQLSTWEVAQLFYPRQRALDASDSSDSSVVIPQILPQIFQEFGLKFGVPNDKLTQVSLGPGGYFSVMVESCFVWYSSVLSNFGLLVEKLCKPPKFSFS